MPKKRRREPAKTVSDSELLTIIQEFTNLYQYAPDDLDIAQRSGYTRESMYNRLRKMERQNLIQRLPLSANEYWSYSWRVNPTMPL